MEAEPEEDSWSASARFYGWFSTACLIATEVYHIVDREWSAYQSIQLFLVTELLSAIFMFALLYNFSRSKTGNDLNKIERAVIKRIGYFVEISGLLFGIGASFSTGNALTVCTYLDDRTRERASLCIETYSSYAAIDGPQGVSNVCASLDENTENPLGGVCPNIVHGDAGTALLAIQFSFVTVLTCLHFVKSKYLHPGNLMASDISMNVNTKIGPSIQQPQNHNQRKPVNSFFLKKLKN